jgi:hypothetical protein
VEAFGHMLAEVRAYGQGIVIADQVPVRLSADIVKNTNLKVIHRLVAGDDRAAMAAAMSMTPQQASQLAVLPPGRAAVFSEGDYMPVIVQVPKSKDEPDAPPVDDAAVRGAMRRWRADPTIATYFRSSRACIAACEDTQICRTARALSELPAARLLATRLFHTAVEHPDGMDVVWPDVETFVAARTAYTIDLRPRVHAFASHALAEVTARRANQAGWPASEVDHLDDLIRAAVTERANNSGRWLGPTASRLALVTAAAALHQRTHDPFPLCGAVCGDGRCPFLHALIDARAAAGHGEPATTDGAEPPPTAILLETAAAVAENVIDACSIAPSGGDVLNAARWRSVACAAQLISCRGDHPHEGAKQVAAALAAAGWTVPTEE